MLSILIPKLILKGAIKTFIVKPLLNSTASIIPSRVFCDASLLGYHSQVSTRNLYKFGSDQILDKFIDRKLDFKIKQLTKYQFEVEPSNEWAKLFFSLSKFGTYDRIILDMREFDKEIEDLMVKALGDMDALETELGEEFNSLLDEFDEDLDEIESILSKQINQLNNLIIVDPIIKRIPEIGNIQKSVVQI